MKKRKPLVRFFLFTGKFYRLMKQGMSGEEALAKVNETSTTNKQDDEDFDDDDDDDEFEDDDEEEST